MRKWLLKKRTIFQHNLNELSIYPKYLKNLTDELILGYHCLWRNIYSESQLNFTKYSLASLFEHSSGTRNLEIPYATYAKY